jgi:hypothetical protein
VFLDFGARLSGGFAHAANKSGDKTDMTGGGRIIKAADNESAVGRFDKHQNFAATFGDRIAQRGRWLPLNPVARWKFSMETSVAEGELGVSVKREEAGSREQFGDGFQKSLSKRFVIMRGVRMFERAF